MAGMVSEGKVGVKTSLSNSIQGHNPTQPGFLATYVVPGAIGHSILRPKDHVLTESQPH